MALKYESLEAFLQSQPISKIEIGLSFKEIESIIRASLPRSAHKFREWWSNQKDSKDHPQAQAWISAGFKVSSVQQKPESGSVMFTRI